MAEEQTLANNGQFDELYEEETRYWKPQWSGGTEVWEPGPPRFRGAQFGVDITLREKYTPLFSLFSEDDTVWHFKLQADVGWLDDLINVLQRAKEALENERSS